MASYTKVEFEYSRSDDLYRLPLLPGICASKYNFDGIQSHPRHNSHVQVAVSFLSCLSRDCCRDLCSNLICEFSLASFAVCLSAQLKRNRS